MRNDKITELYCNKCELHFMEKIAPNERLDCYVCRENLRSDSVPEGILKKYRIQNIKD